jgi:hypothetical protein
MTFEEIIEEIRKMTEELKQDNDKAEAKQS